MMWSKLLLPWNPHISANCSACNRNCSTHRETSPRQCRKVLGTCRTIYQTLFSRMSFQHCHMEEKFNKSIFLWTFQTEIQITLF